MADSFKMNSSVTIPLPRKPSVFSDLASGTVNPPICIFTESAGSDCAPRIAYRLELACDRRVLLEGVVPAFGSISYMTPVLSPDDSVQLSIQIQHVRYSPSGVFICATDATLHHRNKRERLDGSMVFAEDVVLDPVVNVEFGPLIFVLRRA